VPLLRIIDGFFHRQPKEDCQTRAEKKQENGYVVNPLLLNGL
jgi:hypothetical protein